MSDMKRLIFSALVFLTAFCNVNAQQQTDTLVIFFDIDKAIIENKNVEPLKKLITNSNIISISIYGYTDFLGSVVYNRQLSEKRSTNVYNYLLKEGVDKERIVISRGEGIYPNSTKENRQDNSDKGIQAHRIVQVVYTTNSHYNQLSEQHNQKSNENSQLSEEYDQQTKEKPEEFIFLEETVFKLSEENLIVKNLIITNIRFYFNSTTIRPESYSDLEELLKTIQNHNRLKIEIRGHICCQEPDWNVFRSHRESLSRGRAKAVYDYLVENGIKSTRLKYRGFGSNHKIYPNERNEYERQMNRRVEIKIKKI